MIDLKRYDSLIYKLFIDKTSYHGYTIFFNKFKNADIEKYINIRNYFKNRFDNITCGYNEIFYRIKNNIENPPLCKTCGKYVKYTKKTHEYKKYCCVSCKMKDPEIQHHIHEVSIQRYGSINNSKKIHEINMSRSKDDWDKSINKRRNTNRKLYGDENYTNTEKMKQTCVDRYNVTCTLLDNNVKQKTIETLINKYGVDHQSKSPEIKEKMSKGSLLAWEKLTEEERQEKINKLVSYWSSLSEEELQYHGKKVSEGHSKRTKEQKLKYSECSRQRAIKMWESFAEEQIIKIFHDIKEKRKNRTEEQILKEYENRSKAVIKWRSNITDKQQQNTIIKIKETLSKRSKEEWDEIISKIDKTKRINGTYNSSKDEELCAEYIVKFFKNVKRQYKCAEYPYKADFVIFDFAKPIFIEYQGSWTHGHHPFNPDNEDDIKRLEKMSERLKDITVSEHRNSFYESAIKTWTIYDPKKRDIAKRNNLIYYEVWNYNEFKKLIDTLYENR